MSKTRTEEDKINMLAAAFLTGEGKRQNEIAKMLNLHPTFVSRILSNEGKEYVYEEKRFLSEKVPPQLMDKVMKRVSQSKLIELLYHAAIRHGNMRGPVLRVFGCDAPFDDVQGRMNELGKRAAPYVRSLLLRSHHCGLTWGGMLRSTVSALRALNIPPPWKKEKDGAIECIPLSGEPLGNDPTNFSSSSLAHDLGNIINGENYNAPSLAMVPAFVPEGFASQELEGVWKLIKLVESYNQIFGPQDSSRSEKPMAGRLDMILTSVGPAQRALGFGKGSLFETGKLPFKELRNLIIGDVGGVCIARPKLSKKNKERLNGVSTRWTGLRLEHLEHCARRARSHNDLSKAPPGVVVISGGKERAQFVFEIIKLGLVNHLIIDDALEMELERITDLTNYSTSAGTE
jgi:DNA-binding transcriptional regulator LsrR (DeoR family)